MEAVGDGSQFGVNVTYIPQDAPLGLAHCVLIARDFLGDDDFVMYLGDNMLQQGLDGFIDRFEAARNAAGAPTLDGGADAPAAQILLLPGPRSPPLRRGRARRRRATSSAWSRSRPTRRRTSPWSASTCSARRIHDAVAAIEPSERASWRSPTPSSGWPTTATVVRHEVLEGWWLDTGKKDPLLESNRRVLETIESRIEGTLDDLSVIDGRVVLEAGAELVNSQVRGPVIIGAGTRIVNSYVGPFTRHRRRLRDRRQRARALGGAGAAAASSASTG